MELYLSKNGEKNGPFSVYRIGEMLREKEITTSDLGWVKGQEKWLPLNEIPALESVVRQVERVEREEKFGPEVHLEDVEALETAKAEVQAEKKVVVSQEVRPFARFWARSLDYTLVTFVFLFLVEVPEIARNEVTVADLMSVTKMLMEDEQFQRFAQLQTLALVAWHLVEGFLISVFGTTPGKALFSIRVLTSSGNRLPLGTSLLRSSMVLAAGMGFFLSFLPLIGMTLGFFTLLSRGETLWDRYLKLTTHHSVMGPIRLLIAVLAFVVLIILQNLKVL